MSFDPSTEPAVSHSQAPATLLAYMELSRYPQTLAVALCTLIGAVLAEVSLTMTALIAVMVSNVCLFVGATALNDACDVKEDAINKPHRPVPSGRISRTNASVFASVFFILGAILAALVAPLLGIAATVVCVVSVAYATLLKRIAFLGNAVVATVSIYPIYCMLVVGGEPNPMFMHVIVSFLLFRFGAELIKTAEDRAGDSHAGIRTAATVFGEAAIYRVGNIVLILAIVVLSTAPELHWLVATGLLISMLLAIAAFALSLRAMTKAQGRRMIFIERAIIVVMITALTLQILLERII